MNSQLGRPPAMTNGSGWWDALIAATARARLNKQGYAYVVQWPDGHCTADDNKPLIQSRDMRVTEVLNTGEYYD